MATQTGKKLTGIYVLSGFNATSVIIFTDYRWSADWKVLDSGWDFQECLHSLPALVLLPNDEAPEELMRFKQTKQAKGT